MFEKTDPIFYISKVTRYCTVRMPSDCADNINHPLGHWQKLLTFAETA